MWSARSAYHPAAWALARRRHAAAESSAARKAQALAEIQRKLNRTVRGSPQILWSSFTASSSSSSFLEDREDLLEAMDDYEPQGYTGRPSTSR